jgi:predicted P-loop ATPase/GTPase
MENVKTASGITLYDKIKMFFRKPIQYVLFVGALVLGFFVGRLEYKLTESNKQIPTENPFNHLHTDKDISIAVDESNKLLLINVNTGTYQVYSDSIGMSIFKMYSHRLFQSAHE